MGNAVRWADGRITPPSRILHFDYYFGPNDAQLTRMDANNFYEAMQVIVADNAEATARVRNKELEFKNIQDMLYIYRYGGLPPPSLPAPPKKDSTQ